MKRFKGEMSEGGVGVRSEVTMGNNSVGQYCRPEGIIQ